MQDRFELVMMSHAGTCLSNADTFTALSVLASLLLHVSF